MKRIIAIAVAVVLLLAMAIPAPVMAQTEWHVYEGGDIQAAVDGASAGDEVIVHAGIYHQSVVFGSEDSDITLRADLTGEMRPTLDGDGPADTGTTLLVDGIKLLAGVSDVTIEGFEIRNYTGTSSGQGNAIQAWNSGTSDITIENNEMHDNSWNAVLVGNEGQGLHTGWVIENNTIYGNGAYNLELTNAQNSVIEGNTVEGGYAGIVVQARNNVPDSGKVTVSNVRVEENEISDVTIGIYLLALGSTALPPFGPIPGATAELNNVKVEENKVDSAGSEGIRLLGWTGGMLTNSTVAENEVENSGAYGIRVWTGAGGSAGGNTLSENKVEGSETLDCEDTTSGAGTAGTANTWIENECDTSSPDGLCGEEDED